MKAIILAAGEGTRLRPYTADRPKCLVEIGGSSLLDWQISALRSAGIDDIVVVRGYLADRIDRRDVRVYENPRYGETNMVHSLWCAEPEIAGDVIVSYADIVYEPRVVRALVANDADVAVVVDRAWERLWRIRFGDPLDDAETLRMRPDGTLSEIGRKPRSMAEIEAQYIGLLRFRGNGIAALRRTYEAAREDATHGRATWSAPRPFERAYMTDLLQAMIDRGERLTAVPIDGGWFEIDSVLDYEIMRQRFRDGTVREFFDPGDEGSSRRSHGRAPESAHNGLNGHGKRHIFFGQPYHRHREE